MSSRLGSLAGSASLSSDQRRSAGAIGANGGLHGWAPVLAMGGGCGQGDAGRGDAGGGDEAPPRQGKFRFGHDECSLCCLPDPRRPGRSVRTGASKIFFLGRAAASAVDGVADEGLPDWVARGPNARRRIDRSLKTIRAEPEEPVGNGFIFRAAPVSGWIASAQERLAIKAGGGFRWLLSRLVRTTKQSAPRWKTRVSPPGSGEVGAELAIDFCAEGRGLFVPKQGLMNIRRGADHSQEVSGPERRKFASGVCTVRRSGHCRWSTATSPAQRSPSVGRTSVFGPGPESTARRPSPARHRAIAAQIPAALLRGQCPPPEFRSPPRAPGSRPVRTSHPPRHHRPA